MASGQSDICTLHVTSQKCGNTICGTHLKDSDKGTKDNVIIIKLLPVEIEVSQALLHPADIRVVMLWHCAHCSVLLV